MPYWAAWPPQCCSQNCCSSIERLKVALRMDFFAKISILIVLNGSLLVRNKKFSNNLRQNTILITINFLCGWLYVLLNPPFPLLGGHISGVYSPQRLLQWKILNNYNPCKQDDHVLLHCCRENFPAKSELDCKQHRSDSTAVHKVRSKAQMDKCSLCNTETTAEDLHSTASLNTHN